MKDSDKLSVREVEVVKLLADGLSSHIMAKRLNISMHTVKFHINNISTKLNAKNRIHSVLEAIRRGYIDFPSIPQKAA